MKLKKILEAHQRFNDLGSLTDNLGDGYLLKHNQIFRNVRIASHDAGLQFVSKRFHDYEVLPLTQLPKILLNRSVPYVPNVNALKEIEEAMPGVFDLMEVPPLRANYVLHESAHGLARMIRIKYIGEISLDTKKALTSQRSLALAIMMEESFANAAESLLSVYANSEIHQEFLKKNTYIMEDAISKSRMKLAIKTIGLENTFRLVLLSFLYANFLKLKISVSEFERVLTIVLMNDPKKRFGLSKKSVSLLRDVFLGGFDLDPLFTIRTNEFCLRLMGVNTKLDKLFDFDLLESFEMDARYQHCLNSMGKVITTGQI